MEVTITALHFDATERLESFINKKADRLARRFNALTAMDFTLRVVKPETANNKEVLVKAQLPGESELVANKTADSFEEAVDMALEALDQQLERAKGKK